MNIIIDHYNFLNDIPNELNFPKYIIDNKVLIDIELQDSPKVIHNLNRVNFFVGANNSGKSRFLRGIFKLDSFHLSMGTEDPDDLINELRKIDQIFKDNFEGLNEVSTIIQSFIKNYKALKLADQSAYLSNYKNKIPLVKEIESKKEEILLHNSKLSDYALEIINKVTKLNDRIIFHIQNNPSKKTYIPVLRYINSNVELYEEIYLKTIENQYSIIEKGRFKVSVGLNTHGIIDDLRYEASSTEAKENFEKFLSENFFENNKTRIVASKNKVLKLAIGKDDRGLELYNLGDGIQALILVLFPIFMAKKGEWFFVEEPETHLHPGYQRIFLNTLLNNEYLKKKNLRLFFTTHSNHFLDLSLLEEDVSIFQFKKIEKEEIEIKTNIKPSKETLDILGVTNSSVLIANCSIWVEGPTDRKYISKWLNSYAGFDLKEDIDYAFFEYGGNLLAHYLFDNDFDDLETSVRDKISAFALSNRIYLLADNDKPKLNSPKAIRRKNLEDLSREKDQFAYQNTEVKEIENLLPVQILKDFLPELIKNEHSDLIKKISFEMKDYKEVGLGSFFEKLLLDNEIPEDDIKAFKADSGTLNANYKMKLCDFVINKDYSWNQFSTKNEVLNNIIKRLYDFIVRKK